MTQSFSKVTSAAVASVVAMSAFALTVSVPVQTAPVAQIAAATATAPVNG